MGLETAEEREAFDLDRSEQPLFSEFLAPFLTVYLRQCLERCGPALTSEARFSIARALRRRLSRLCARTIAYELKLANSRGELPGTSSQAQYAYFVDEFLARPHERIRLFLAYPVLARMLAVVTANMIEVTAEVMARCREDADEIRAKLNGGVGLGPLSLCYAGLSDMHCGGRSAWILQFRSGFKVVYKPRPHEVDAAYASFIEWLNRKGADLRAARVIVKSEYGWSEFIANEPCQSEAEVARYYRRQGAHAALVYYLCGQDFHADNFVANGEYPVPVDLEGILSPSIAVPVGDLASVPLPLRSLQFSVSNSLLVPYWRSGDFEKPLFQSSGIGGPESANGQ